MNTIMGMTYAGDYNSQISTTKSLSQRALARYWKGESSMICRISQIIVVVFAFSLIQGISQSQAQENTVYDREPCVPNAFKAEGWDVPGLPEVVGFGRSSKETRCSCSIERQELELVSKKFVDIEYPCSKRNGTTYIQHHTGVLFSLKLLTYSDSSARTIYAVEMCIVPITREELNKGESLPGRLLCSHFVDTGGNGIFQLFTAGDPTTEHLMATCCGRNIIPTIPQESPKAKPSPPPKK